MGDAIRPTADQSFLGRVFDSYQNMTQIASCLREAARQRSIATPHVLELSRRATGLEDYIPEAQITRYPTHNDNQPILSDPVALPFADKSFDSSLITDVYDLLREDNSWATREVEHLNSTIRQLQQDREWAKGEIEHLTSVIRQLQQDNQWATQEIERLSSPLANKYETESSP